MSKISNTLPQEGDALSSTDLNSLFTAWNGATNTAMNEDNAANQSVDITNLNLQANSGKAGFILKDMQGHDIANPSGVTLASEQDVGTAPSFNTVTNSTFSFGASGKTIATNDTLRIYYNLRVGDIAYASPFTASVNAWNVCWATWLEYAAAWSGAAPTTWTPVPGQGDFATSVYTSGSTTMYGLRLNNMRGTTIIPHQMGENTGGSVRRINTTQQDFNGQYYLKHAGANTTWYGLRIRIGGVFYAFNTGGNNYIAFNSHATTPHVAAGNILTYYNGNIAYFQMTSN